MWLKMIRVYYAKDELQGAEERVKSGVGGGEVGRRQGGIRGEKGYLRSRM